MKSPRNKKSISALLLLGILCGAFLAPPRETRAVVPVFEKNPVLVGDASLQTEKNIADPWVTALIKAVIRMVRDMVIRWILTGKFDLPVFSTSFMVDLQQTVANAARIYLSGLTGINFCGPYPSVPPSAYGALSGYFALECSFPGAPEEHEQFLRGGNGSYISYFSTLNTENDYWNTQIAIINQKLQAEQRALQAFLYEYGAGQGFLPIKDAVSGLTKTPANYVKELLVENTIVSPSRGVDVANTVQQAIDAIIATAFTVIINQGLAGANDIIGGEGFRFDGGVGGGSFPFPGGNPLP